VVIARGVAPLPPAGTPITAGERPIGTLMSSAGGTGLAIVRLDRAKEAIDAGQPLTAGQSVVTLSLPDWAKFGWPAVAGED
jgi:folate-binding Fe-S cluster repair protein YgfZ